MNYKKYSKNKLIDLDGENKNYYLNNPLPKIKTKYIIDILLLLQFYAAFFSRTNE